MELETNLVSLTQAVDQPIESHSCSVVHLSPDQLAKVFGGNAADPPKLAPPSGGSG